MCGIAGILGRQSPQLRRSAERMADAMVHRGPDGSGVWESAPDAHGLCCVLAHRRLAIIDLSDASSQPLTERRSGSTVVFNGEIYNYRTIKERLRSGGEDFVSHGDTEVVLKGVLRAGSAFMGELRGMFALGIWDESRRRLCLARDALGIKPLYVCRNPDPDEDWSFIFASEVRAILASGVLPGSRIDPVGLATFIWNGFVVSPSTIVQGIESFAAGEAVEFDLHGAERSRRSFRRPRAVPREQVPDLAGSLRDTVGAHLVSDVPVGVFLSAGVDSGAVANLARCQSAEPPRTFTLSVEEAELDEGGAARAIAEAIGSRHTEYVLTEDEFVENLDRAIESIDQPTFDGINTYYMSMAVRRAGLTVALVGTGGDELFGGYRSFRELPKLLRLNAGTGWIPSPLRAGAAAAIGAVRGFHAGPVPPQTRWAKLPEMILAGDDLIRLYQLAYALFLPAFAAKLLDDPCAGGGVRDGLPLAFRERIAADVSGTSPLRAISMMEQRCFLGERLLRDTDAASMSVSLEIRTPFVDTELNEAADGLPDAHRYRPLGRKQLLRTAGHSGLDPGLFERPKSGFVLPFDRWIRRGLGSAMDEVMSDPRLVRAAGLNAPAVADLWRSFREGSTRVYWSRVWAIYVLVRWCHTHGVLA